ncbi:bifunctional 4-hydroxy-2-oxoglutarate aldolase/2-dehydro-3-deoxy-phosphogluconate aldolase [Reinekea sp.]|jgi:2-dehydro-3-deoxyphosphogluconate aldolase/(4S)-4-hydroxy-2-oxoglutarate aldolase|uniref:bifunctional 4-hydroxy-2-oxoglutarate aldolase/2-dehydro-3-deoxy-phosphogluconate aldolase n=1 Tax=Reinekea sp. TaxID=1970455 RepID=UPI002A80A813|nr:bifunctional 4-hydroxy-2-oxoglutarate aldolase/2-dehydro-3-deoxy-phosphogluconate aldolase [Reinekea sp.]
MKYTVEQIMSQAFPVMPVLAVERVEDAIPLAQALRDGGLTVLEVTLRTANAMAVIEAMKTVAGVIVGAGTVTRAEQLHELLRIGADFAISPGATPGLLAEGKRVNLAFLPAIATVSEMMQGLELGYQHFKFFPAAAAGGTAALKSFSGPFPNVQFCPTGGISVRNFKDYLALDNVTCVGGSWLVPADALAEQDWPRIEALARAACFLV